MEGFGLAEYYNLHAALHAAGFPKPWNKLKKEHRAKLTKAITEWKTARLEWKPPLVINRLPVDPIQSKTDSTSFDWTPAEPVVFQAPDALRFFGSIQIDPAYNESEVIKAFRKWFAGHREKDNEGGQHGFQGKLHDLAALRVRHHVEKRARRFELLFEATGMRSYYTAEKRPKLRPTDSLRDVAASRSPGAEGLMKLVKGLASPPDSTPTGTADVVLSRSCKSAVAFFKTLFPSETPLSAARLSRGES